MSKRIDLNPDYVRAVTLLKNKFHTPDDLIRYWAFSGPCLEPHPSIEDIVD